MDRLKKEDHDFFTKVTCTHISGDNTIKKATKIVIIKDETAPVRIEIIKFINGV